MTPSKTGRFSSTISTMNVEEMALDFGVDPGALVRGIHALCAEHMFSKPSDILPTFDLYDVDQDTTTTDQRRVVWSSSTAYALSVEITPNSTWDGSYVKSIKGVISRSKGDNEGSGDGVRLILRRGKTSAEYQYEEHLVHDTFEIPIGHAWNGASMKLVAFYEGELEAADAEKVSMSLAADIVADPVEALNTSRLATLARNPSLADVQTQKITADIKVTEQVAGTAALELLRETNLLQVSSDGQTAPGAIFSNLRETTNTAIQASQNAKFSGSKGGRRSLAGRGLDMLTSAAKSVGRTR